MPPHCDSLDGPVVRAARAALVAADVDLVLPFVHLEGEDEVRSAFDETLKVRELGPEARGLADRWFFETVVRVHRAGEGAPYTGLKPSGLDVGPVIPAAERSLSDGSAEELVDVLCGELRMEVERRHAEAMILKQHADEDLVGMRSYVEAMLGLQVWAHSVHRRVMSAPHAHPAPQGREKAPG
jgi:Family of unknown function (DUF6448)